MVLGLAGGGAEHVRRHDSGECRPRRHELGWGNGRGDRGAPLGAWNRVGVAGTVLSGGEGRSSGSVFASEGFRVARGFDSWVPEHHQATRKMNTGSREAMRVCRGWLTVGI